MKLDLGSGPFSPPDADRWVQVDIAPEDKPDIAADARALPFGESSLDGILASHVLEHLSGVDGAVMLAECLRVLKPEATLTVRVPDMRAVYTCYVQGFQPPKDNGLLRVTNEMGEPVGYDLRDLYWVNHLFVHSSCQRSPHLWGYDKQTLTRALIQAGFEYIKTGVRRDWWEVVLEARTSPGQGFERLRLRAA